MPGARSGCQTERGQRSSAAAAGQINNPLLKLKRFVCRAAGHAVPESDTRHTGEGLEPLQPGPAAPRQSLNTVWPWRERRGGAY